jgi:hypothetical protein
VENKQQLLSLILRHSSHQVGFRESTKATSSSSSAKLSLILANTFASLGRENHCFLFQNSTFFPESALRLCSFPRFQTQTFPEEKRPEEGNPKQNVFRVKFEDNHAGDFRFPKFL